MAVIEQERVQADVAPATTNPVADILDRAADLIERDGWFRGSFRLNDACSSFYKEGGSHDRCALIALIAAGSGEDGCDAFASYLGVRDSFAIADWNNDPSRTKAEVVTALRCAAVAAAR